MCFSGDCQRFFDRLTQNIFFILTIRRFCGIISVTFKTRDSVNERNNTMSERRLNFDCGWKFTKNIPPLIDRYRGGHPSYVTTRCGERCPFSKSEYNDSRWMSVDLPHDWIVGEPYDETALASHGYQKAGYAWYRKVFEIDVSLRGKQFTLPLPTKRQWLSYFDRMIQTT